MKPTEQKSHASLERLAWITLGATLLVILWGAFVRASGSGAGCGDHWPLCNGQVLPQSASVKTFVELTHRLTSGLSLLFALALYWRCRGALTVGHPGRSGAGWTLIFFIVEALIGAALVKFRLVEGDASAARAVVIALHLCNTFALLTVLLWTAMNLREPRRLHLRDEPRLAWLLGAGVAALLLVGASGGVTALGDTLFPAESLAEGIAQDLSPTAHFLIRLRVLHPIFAVATALLWLALALRSRLDASAPGIRRAATAVSAVVTLQTLCGVLNLLWLAPTWLQLTHLALADALWLSVIWLVVERLSSPVALDAAAT